MATSGINYDKWNKIGESDSDPDGGPLSWPHQADTDEDSDTDLPGSTSCGHGAGNGQTAQKPGAHPGKPAKPALPAFNFNSSLASAGGKAAARAEGSDADSDTPPDLVTDDEDATPAPRASLRTPQPQQPAPPTPTSRPAKAAAPSASQPSRGSQGCSSDEDEPPPLLERSSEGESDAGQSDAASDSFDEPPALMSENSDSESTTAAARRAAPPNPAGLPGHAAVAAVELPGVQSEEEQEETDSYQKRCAKRGKQDTSSSATRTAAAPPARQPAPAPPQASRPAPVRPPALSDTDDEDVPELLDSPDATEDERSDEDVAPPPARKPPPASATPAPSAQASREESEAAKVARMEALARQQADADRMAQRLLAEEEAAKARKAEREKEVQRVREAQREKAREKARKKKEKKKDRKKKGAQGKPTEVSEDEDEEGPAASSQPGSGSAAAGAGPSVAQLPLGSHGIADNRSDSEEDGWELAGSRTAGSSSRTRGLPARASITSQGDAQQGHALGRVISEDGAELDGWTAVGAASGAFSVLSENHRSASSAPSAPRTQPSRQGIQDAFGSVQPDPVRAGHGAAAARPGPTIERSEMWRSIDAAMEARDQPRLEAALRTASYWLATHTSSPLASELRPKMNEGRNLLKQLSERVQQRAGPSGRGSVPQAAPIRSQPAPSLVASSAAATSGAGRVASPGPLPSRAPVAAGRSGGYAVPAAGGRGQGVGGRGAAPPAPPPQRGAPHYGGMPRGPPTGLAPAVAALFSANAQAAAAAPAAPGVANARVRSPPPYGGPSAAFLGQSAQYRPPLQPQRPTPAPAPLRFVPPEPFAAQTGLSPGGQDGGQEYDDEELCIVCMEHPKDTIFVPCGHHNTCHACAEAVVTTSGLCPTCRMNISEHFQAAYS